MKRLLFLILVGFSLPVLAVPLDFDEEDFAPVLVFDDGSAGDFGTNSVLVAPLALEAGATNRVRGSIDTLSASLIDPNLTFDFVDVWSTQNLATVVVESVSMVVSNFQSVPFIDPIDATVAIWGDGDNNDRVVAINGDGLYAFDTDVGVNDLFNFVVVTDDIVSFDYEWFVQVAPAPGPTPAPAPAAILLFLMGLGALALARR